MQKVKLDLNVKEEDDFSPEQLFQQNLPIGTVLFKENTSSTKNLKFNASSSYEHVDFKDNFKDFRASSLPTVTGKRISFPGDTRPYFGTEDDTKTNFEKNVLDPINKALQNKFEILRQKRLAGFNTDCILRGCTSEKDVLVIEVKQWQAFTNEIPNAGNVKELLEESVNVTEKAEVLKENISEQQKEEGKDGFGSLPIKDQEQIRARARDRKKPNETHGQHHFRLGVKQLVTYLDQLARTVAYGILTSYCHTYFVILECTDRKKMLTISPVVKYSDTEVLKKIAEFIQLALEAPIVERDVIAHLLTEGTGDVADGSKDANGGKTVEDEQGRNTRKRRKTEDKTEHRQADGEGSHKCGQEQQDVIDGDYIIREVIGTGRSGCVVQMIDPVGNPYAAKLVGERSRKDESTKVIIRELQNEKAMYERLKELQGVVVPRFHCSGTLYGSMYTLVMQKLVAVPISERDLSKEQKNAIIAALDMIHEKGVLHGDIRSSNILIDDNNCAFFVDFAWASVCNSESELKAEKNQLRALLNMDLLK